MMQGLDNYGLQKLSPHHLCMQFCLCFEYTAKLNQHSHEMSVIEETKTPSNKWKEGLGSKNRKAPTLSAASP